MKNKLIFLISFLSCSFLSYTQENFKPGFIVNLRGDTLIGFIDYRNWDMNPVKITFRDSDISEKQLLSPSEILAFGVSGENYISAIVKVEISPFLVNELKIDPELHLETDTAFIYRLVQGNKSLYHYKDSRNRDQFYVPSDTGMTLLIHKVYLKEVKDRDVPAIKHGSSQFMQNKYYYRTENKYYLGQLASYLQDCQAILPIISSVEYKQSDLLKLFHVYQKKCDETVKMNSARETRTEFGAISGISLNSLEWSNNKTFDFCRTDYNYKLNLAIGLFLELKFRGNKWSLNNELLYTPFKVQGTYMNYVNEERYTEIETTIGSGYIKLSNMIRYSYRIHNSRIFANFGISNSIGSLKYNDFSSYTRMYTEEYYKSGNALKNTDKHELGFNFGLGLAYKKWQIEGRWEQGDGMSSLAALSSKTKRYYFLLGYRFGSKNQN